MTDISGQKVSNVDLYPYVQKPVDVCPHYELCERIHRILAGFRYTMWESHCRLHCVQARGMVSSLEDEMQAMFDCGIPLTSVFLDWYEKHMYAMMEHTPKRNPIDKIHLRVVGLGDGKQWVWVHNLPLFFRGDLKQLIVSVRMRLGLPDAELSCYPVSRRPTTPWELLIIHTGDTDAVVSWLHISLSIHPSNVVVHVAEVMI